LNRRGPAVRRLGKDAQGSRIQGHRDRGCRRYIRRIKGRGERKGIRRSRISVSRLENGITRHIRDGYSVRRNIVGGDDGGSPSGLRRAPSGRTLSELTLLHFFFLVVFVFPILICFFAVFPGGIHPQPQFIFFDIMSPLFVLSVFLPPPIVGIRRCNAWRSPAVVGTPGSVSPPS